MTDIDLKNYVKSVLRAHGALVEDQGQSLEAVLPGDLAKLLNEPGFLVLNFLSPVFGQKENGQLVRYGSAILEKFNHLAQTRGFAAEAVTEGLYLKQEGLKEALARQFEFLHMKPVWQGTKRESHNYTVINFKYSASSDDRRDGLVSVMLSEHTLAAPPEMQKIIEEQILLADGGSVASKDIASSAIPLKPLNEVLGVAAKRAERQVRQSLAEFIKSMERRQERDLNRVGEYYKSLQAEINQFIARRRPIGAELKKQQGKLSAVEREREYKLGDLKNKYSVEVGLNVVSVLRISVQVLVNEVKTLKGKEENKLYLIWNPVIKKFDPVVCQNCSDQIYTVASCEAWHWLCPVCAAPCAKCGKKFCPVCAPVCPRCGEKKDGF